MADYNKVFLIGRLTKDPELRSTPNGASVSDLSLATSRKYRTRDNEERTDTLYIDVTVWNRQAENCHRYLRKGSAIFVEGSLKMDRWETPEGKRTKHKVEAISVQFLDRPGDGAARGRDDSSEYESDNDGPMRRAHNGGFDGDSRDNFGGYNHSPGPRSGANRSTLPPSGESDEDIPF